MAFPFEEEKSAPRYRLEILTSRLSDADLSRSNLDGWSVAAILAHLAFWDRRVLVLLHRWKEQGLDDMEWLL